jgi:hypothetical protein
MNDNYTLVKKAILEKKQITAIYKGYYRELCPHNLGTKNGRRQGLFYQFGGHSSSGTIIPGSLSNWRCILIDDLSDVKIQDGPWYTASNHSTPSTCVDVIEVEVRF